jgi:hypothetical protein
MAQNPFFGFLEAERPDASFSAEYYGGESLGSD